MKNNGKIGGNSEDDTWIMTGSTTESATQKIDISDIFFDTTTAAELHTIKKRRKRKPRRSRTQRYVKQAANSDAGTGGQQSEMNINQQEGQSSSNGSNGNANNDQNELPPSQFNKDRCPVKLENTDTVNVEDFQTYIATIKFKEVPTDNVAKV